MEPVGLVDGDRLPSGREAIDEATSRGEDRPEIEHVHTFAVKTSGCGNDPAIHGPDHPHERFRAGGGYKEPVDRGGTALHISSHHSCHAYGVFARPGGSAAFRVPEREALVSSHEHRDDVG